MIAPATKLQQLEQRVTPRDLKIFAFAPVVFVLNAVDEFLQFFDGFAFALGSANVDHSVRRRESVSAFRRFGCLECLAHVHWR